MLSLLWSFLLSLLRTEGAVSDSLFVMKNKSTDIAPLGNNVTLKCNLTIPADVLQVTWQKVQGSIPKNIGTYSSQYGGKIFPPYNERIHHSSAELTSSSMTIYNVTLEDDACYKCLFNVFPNGIHGGQMCFSVQNVSELRIECHPHPDEGILIAICSATGKPAPHINFSHESLLMESPKEHIDENPDGIANVTKWYNISLEAMRSLKLWNISCDMDHPLKKIKKHVCFPQESESVSYYSSLRVHKYLMASLLMCPLTFIIYFLIFKIKRIQNTNNHSSAQNLSSEKPNKDKPMEPGPKKDNILNHNEAIAII